MPSNPPATAPPGDQRTADRSYAELLVIGLGLVLPAAVTYVFFVAAADLPPATQRVTMAVSKITQFALPLVWWFVIRRGRLTLPYPTRGGWLLGTLFGVTVAATMWLGYFFLIKPNGWLGELPGAVTEKVTELGCDTVWRYALLGLFYTVIHSLLEEYYWRWFVFGGLKRYVSSTTAIAISSLGFMAHHVIVLGKFLGWTSPGAWLLSLAVAIGGACWAWLYHRTGQLYPAWLSHLIVDAAIFALGYLLVFA